MRSTVLQLNCQNKLVRCAAPDVSHNDGGRPGIRKSASVDLIIVQCGVRVCVYVCVVV